MADLLTREEWGTRTLKGTTSAGALRKGFFSVEYSKADGDPDSPIRTFTITTDSPDRDRDVISAGGWKLENYQKNPVVLWAHDYKQPSIGKSIGLRATGNSLVADVEFAPKEVYPFAQTIKGLLDFGALKATSVGMDPLKWAYNESRGGYDFIEQELLEFSVVPVPANAEALQLALAKGVATGPMRDWIEATAKAWGYVLKRPVECSRGECPNTGDDATSCPVMSGCPLKAEAAEVEKQAQVALLVDARVKAALAEFKAAHPVLIDKAPEAEPDGELFLIDTDLLKADEPDGVAFDPEQFKAAFLETVGPAVKDAVDARFRAITGRLD